MGADSINVVMRVFHMRPTESSLKQRRRGCEKTDSATEKTDTCQVPGTSAMRRQRCGKHIVGKVGGWEGELAGYAKVLLRACDAHGTRVPSMRPDERQLNMS